MGDGTVSLGGLACLPSRHRHGSHVVRNAAQVGRRFVWKEGTIAPSPQALLYTMNATTPHHVQSEVELEIKMSAAYMFREQGDRGGWRRVEDAAWYGTVATYIPEELSRARMCRLSVYYHLNSLVVDIYNP